MTGINLNLFQIDPAAIRMVPESIARKYNLIPLALSGDALRVGMADPHDVLALQELSAFINVRVEPVPADLRQVREAIDLNYTARGEIEGQFKDAGPFNDAPLPTFKEDISDAPAVRALDLIINEAVKFRASDIHVEPEESRLRVRFRIDGVLQDMMSLPLSAHSPLLARIKIMSGMNIDRRPQDGQFSVRVRNQDIDVRVATIETIYGEMASLRILDKAFAARSLPDLGFLPGSLEKYEHMLKSPLGMILVSGPTGSGKTTTLYASINNLDSTGRKIVTIEDPVEYRFNKIDQIQINPKAGLTFASGLRSLMRHDPDVIMVGEIRDADTAEIATRMALTGQLVLSSVHATDTVGAVYRLLDLGIGPFLISATLIGVVSQRMVRRICPYCARPVAAPPEARLAYQQEMEEERTEFLYGQGCNSCAGTGYLGRVAISEVMAVDEDIRNGILSGASADSLRQITKKAGMVSMWRDGMLKVKENITTPSEVLRKIYSG